MGETKGTLEGWKVTFAGTGINLALGVLYAWSILSGGLTGWTETMKSLPYSLACGVFAITMIPAGRLQDRIGPRWVATVSGLLTGIGFILCWAYTSFAGFLVGFGLLVGIGIGFGYAAATPPAIKWFHASRTGLIAGLVVSGFGLASAYIGPLARTMIDEWGLQTSMLVMGLSFLVIVVGLAQFLKNPPAGYVPPVPASAGAKKQSAAAAPARDVEPGKMVRTSQFWMLWVMYACGAGAGLMIIGKLKPIVKNASDLAWFAPLCLAILAVGNAGGRIIAGVLSDKLGRFTTMLVIFLLQAAVMMGLIFVGSEPAVVVGVSLMGGFNYGANLSLFPSATKDLFGLKNFGVNYGILFTAWGVGGVVLPIVAGRVADATGSFNLAYIVAAVCLVLASIMTFFIRRGDGPAASTVGAKVGEAGAAVK